MNFVRIMFCENNSYIEILLSVEIIRIRIMQSILKEIPTQR